MTGKTNVSSLITTGNIASVRDGKASGVQGFNRTYYNQKIGTLVHVVSTFAGNQYEWQSVTSVSGLKQISYRNDGYNVDNRSNWTTCLSAWYVVTSPTINIQMSGRGSVFIN